MQAQKGAFSHAALPPQAHSHSLCLLTHSVHDQRWDCKMLAQHPGDSPFTAKASHQHLSVFFLGEEHGTGELE